MRKRTPLFAWQIVENQEDRGYTSWPPAEDTTPNTQAAQRRLRRLYLWGGLLALWQPLLDGLYLWQLWDLDMPLAHWRHDVVTWLYVDLPVADPERHSVLLSESYREFCAMHSLWMLAPTLLRIPFECTAQEPATWSQRRWVANLPRTRLAQLTMPRTGYYQFYDEENFFYRSTEAVKVAILVEYAVAAYGNEQLPVLLASLAQHDTWDTLIPAVYGVSSSEFEEGWQTYLTARYR